MSTLFSISYNVVFSESTQSTQIIDTTAITTALIMKTTATIGKYGFKRIDEKEVVSQDSFVFFLLNRVNILKNNNTRLAIFSCNYCDSRICLASNQLIGRNNTTTPTNHSTRNTTTKIDDITTRLMIETDNVISSTTSSMREITMKIKETTDSTTNFITDKITRTEDLTTFTNTFMTESTTNIDDTTNSEITSDPQITTKVDEFYSTLTGMYFVLILKQ